MFVAGMDAALEVLKAWIPTGSIFVVVFLILMGTRHLLDRWYSGSAGFQFRVQLAMLSLSFLGLLAVLLSLPVSETLTAQLLSLLGLILSAAIALSSTTILGNILAGLMQRAVKNFRAGDFISVEDHFGRVSEQGLFHVEIQTQDRDLITLPNLYLATQPVKVVRSSGTIIWATVSLGYDVDRKRARDLLIEAAENTGLEEAFVQVTELGDFAVTYRVAGLLQEVKNLISTRSRLREMMLDSLHRGQVEIVSPNFMNQRVLDAQRLFIPPTVEADSLPATEEVSAEQIAFDKADAAESIEKLRMELEKICQQIEQVEGQLSGVEDPQEKARLETELSRLQPRRERLTAEILRREEAHAAEEEKAP